ncbi:MAG TPA: hypothetical protein VEQ61_06500 [Thermoleophilaceae bacterium]|nr:hypothetical protein [Thermoleophilaceae bacterium]
MFPGLRQRISTALDLLVEFSTLGEYRLAATPAAGAAGVPPSVSEPELQLGGAGSAGVAGVRRTPAGGVVGPWQGQRPQGAGPVTATTPAARRPRVAGHGQPPHELMARPGCVGTRRHDPAERGSSPHAKRRRPGAAPRAEQLCLALD